MEFPELGCPDADPTVDSDLAETGAQQVPTPGISR
jgi:hypothetical protein